jgi:hypothetical protein
MMMVFREENPLPNAPLPQLMPWELLRAIAIIQLYLEERFIEPPQMKRMPFSLLFQQTLSTLASCGELSAKELAERVLTLPPFAYVSPEDYKTLLVSMLNNEYLEMTENNGQCSGYFISRFFVSDITTGRNGLMAQYNEFIIKNPKVMFFGIGLQDYGNRLLNLYNAAVHLPQ